MRRVIADPESPSDQFCDPGTGPERRRKAARERTVEQMADQPLALCLAQLRGSTGGGAGRQLLVFTQRTPATNRAPIDTQLSGNFDRAESLTQQLPSLQTTALQVFRTSMWAWHRIPPAHTLGHYLRKRQ